MDTLSLTKKAKIHNREIIISLTRGAGKTGQPSVKEPYTKINSKWIKDLNVRPETIKLPEENIGRTLSEITHRKILYDPSPRILEIKAKINKWDLIKIKSFFNVLEVISSLSHSIAFLYFIVLIAEEGFPVSPCYSLELCIQMGVYFLFFFAFSFYSFLSYV